MQLTQFLLVNSALATAILTVPCYREQRRAAPPPQLLRNDALLALYRIDDDLVYFDRRPDRDTTYVGDLVPTTTTVLQMSESVLAAGNFRLVL